MSAALAEDVVHVTRHPELATSAEGKAKLAWLGTYADRMVLEPDGVWRFRRRRIIVEGTG